MGASEGAHARGLACLLCAAGCLTLTLAGCGSSNASASRGSSGARSAEPRSVSGKATGPVAVLYAGSLVNLLEHRLAPRFDAASGYTFEGFSGGSEELVQQIKGRVRRGDVFLSASEAPNAALEGSRNGNWVSWYATFATSSLLIAYNPSSRFASALRSKRWWKVLTEPGFRLGRTDPKLDPKGKLIVQALEQASREHEDPALMRLAHESSEVFPEEALVGRLQSGQLDAGFFYEVEADAVKPKLPTISISPVSVSATYTVTVLKRAPHAAAADAFVRYLLSADARATLSAAGLRETKPTVHGQMSAVPTALREILQSER